MKTPTIASVKQIIANDPNKRCLVLNATSYAHCLIKRYDKALFYMQRELELVSELKDVSSQCRVLSNIGHTYYKLRKFNESLEAHRRCLRLSLRNDMFLQASSALNAIGHVHYAQQDYASAFESHTRSLDILKSLDKSEFLQIREVLAIAHIYSMLNNLKTAEEKYREALQMLDSQHIIAALTSDEHQSEFVMVHFDLACLAARRAQYLDSKHHYEQAMKHAQRMQPSNRRRHQYEMRAANGIGQALRCLGKLDEAREWFERQLQFAEDAHDRTGQSHALSNLGLNYKHSRETSSSESVQ